jgi:hypothetical protein
MPRRCLAGARRAPKFSIDPLSDCLARVSILVLLFSYAYLSLFSLVPLILQYDRSECKKTSMDAYGWVDEAIGRRHVL